MDKHWQLLEQKEHGQHVHVLLGSGAEAQSHALSTTEAVPCPTAPHAAHPARPAPLPSATSVTLSWFSLDTLAHLNQHTYVDKGHSAHL